MAATVTVVALAAAVASAAMRGPEPASTAYLTDAQGRALVIRGFNTDGQAKVRPDGMPATTPAQVATERRDMATNAVRLLISWRAIEPTPGDIDEAYLDRLAQRVEKYGEQGFHVVLDMHQDVYGYYRPTAQSPTFGSGPYQGNGAPAWATYIDGLKTQTGLPMWELSYLEPGTMRAWDHFWGTTGAHSELQDHYLHAWVAVAQRFAGDPTVVAFDLMNEPYGGTRQGVEFEAGPLTALYQRLLTGIRRVDRDHWVCVEPQALGTNWGTPSGLGALVDPRTGSARIAYCPHLYPPPLELGDGYSGRSRGQVDATLRFWRDNVLRVARRLDARGDGADTVPIILGEFGLDTDQPGAAAFLAKVVATAEDMGAGWLYWSRDPGAWGPYDDAGAPRNVVEVFATPTPVAVAGTLLDWDTTSEELTIRWRPAAGVTTVRVPTTSWGLLEPVVTSETGVRAVRWDPRSGTLELGTSGSAEVVEVRVTPRRS